MSPFSIQIHLGAEQPITFQSWIEEAFSKVLPEGAPFANAICSFGAGHIVTNGQMFLSSHAPFANGDILEPGVYVASGAADGDQIPYGKPYCVFVLGNATEAVHSSAT